MQTPLQICVCIRQTDYSKRCRKVQYLSAKENNYQNWENHFVAPHCHVSLNCHLYDDSY